MGICRLCSDAGTVGVYIATIRINDNEWIDVCYDHLVELVGTAVAEAVT